MAWEDEAHVFGLEAQREELRAEIKRLRAALEEIANEPPTLIELEGHPIINKGYRLAHEVLANREIQ